MRNLAYILISTFCLACFCSCSIGEKLQARIEKKRLNDEFEFSLDSIKKIASAYRGDTCIHEFAICDGDKRPNRLLSFVLYPENITDKGTITKIRHLSNGTIWLEQYDYSISSDF